QGGHPGAFACGCQRMGQGRHPREHGVPDGDDGRGQVLERVRPGALPGVVVEGAARPIRRPGDRRRPDRGVTAVVPVSNRMRHFVPCDHSTLVDLLPCPNSPVNSCGSRQATDPTIVDCDTSIRYRGYVSIEESCEPAFPGGDATECMSPQRAPSPGTAAALGPRRATVASTWWRSAWCTCTSVSTTAATPR